MASGVGPGLQNFERVDIRDEEQLQRVRARHEQVRRRRKTLFDDSGLAEHSGYLKKPKKPPMKELTTSNGYKVYTPDVIDWSDWLDVFNAEDSELSETYKNDKRFRQLKSMADFVDYAFNVSPAVNKDMGDLDYVQCPEGSHILSMEYNRPFKILKVEFWNHSVVCYFYVPGEVYSALRVLALRGGTRIGMDGKMRHLVGIYFWDLIRLRGTVHGNRYDCCYIAHGEGSGYVRPMKATDYRLNKNIEKKIRKLEGIVKDMKYRNADADAIKQMEELLEKTKEERYYVAHKRHLTPEEAGRVGDIRADLSRDGGDPDRPLKTFLQRSSGTALMINKANALCEMMDRLAAKAFSRKGSSALLAEYNKEGERHMGEDKYAGYLRKEEWLIKKGLWPRYYK